MKKAVVTIIFLLAAVICAYSGELSVGVGYPYFSLKYSPVELRYATGDGINVFAGRGYLYFWDNNVTRGYTGVEGGYLKFNTMDMKGTGYEGSIFIGGECFVAESLSLAVDIAPTYISLKSEDNYKAGGMEIVANISVNYYFSRNLKDEPKRNSKVKKAAAENEEATAEDEETVAEDEEAVAEDEVVDSPKKTNNDKLINSYLDRASKLESEGEYKQSIAEYKKVLRLDPENETASEEIERIKSLIMEE